MAAKRFKLKFSGAIHSLQLCRSKDFLDSPQHSSPAVIHRRKPTSSVQFPAPPPSTPERHGEFGGQIADYPRKRGSKDRVNKIPLNKVFSTSTSFSDDSSFEFARVEIKSRGRGGSKGGLNLNIVGSKTETAPDRSTSLQLAEGKVRGSVAVVTKSEDPQEDFKRSMVEMIVENEMFEAEDLEQLLQCLLSLNCEAYHSVILQAFIDVWGDLFCAIDTKMREHSHRRSVTFRKEQQKCNL